MKKLILMIVVLSLTFCTEKVEVNSKDFQVTTSVTSEKSRRLGLSVVPRFVTIHEGNIFFCDMENQTHFYVYRLEDFNFIGSFGKEDNSIGAIFNPCFTDQIETVGNNTFLTVLQMDKLELTTFDFNKALNNSLTPEDIKTIKLPESIDEAVHVIKLNNNLIFGSGYSDIGEFFIYNSGSSQLQWKAFSQEYSQEFMQQLEDSELLGLYKYGIIKAKPDKSKFVKAYRYSEKIVIYNNEGNIIYTINRNSPKPEILPNNQFSDNTELYYGNVYTTDNFIYALNINCKVSEEISNVEIHVFDWEGNAIEMINLNKGIGGLAPFAVDETTRTIYSINPTTESDLISEFRY